MFSIKKWILAAALASNPCTAPSIKFSSRKFGVQGVPLSKIEENFVSVTVENSFRQATAPSLKLARLGLIEKFEELKAAKTGKSAETLIDVVCWLEGEEDPEKKTEGVFKTTVICADPSGFKFRSSATATLKGSGGLRRFLGQSEEEEPTNDVSAEVKLYHISKTKQAGGAMVDFTRVETEEPDGTKFVRYLLEDYKTLLKRKEDEAKKNIRLTVRWVTQIPETKLPDQASLEAYTQEVVKEFGDGPSVREIHERFASAATQLAGDGKEQSEQVDLTCWWTGVYNPDEPQNTAFLIQLLCRIQTLSVKEATFKNYQLTNSHAARTSPMLAFLGDLWAQKYSPEPDATFGNVKLYRIEQPEYSKTDFTRVVTQLSPGKEVIGNHVGDYNMFLASFSGDKPVSCAESIKCAIKKCFGYCCPFMGKRKQHANQPVQVEKSRARGRQLTKRYSKTCGKRSSASWVKRHHKRRSLGGKKPRKSHK